METQSLKIRPCKCLVCHRPAHQHHCGVPTCKGCKTFFRRMYVSQKIDKCQFDMKCFDEAGRENCNIRCQYCRFQKCIQVGMNPSDLRISGAESLNALTTTSDNLPLLLKQLAQFDTHRTHLLKNCSYDGDPSIDEISCLTQNLNFQCTPMAHDQPIIEWSFFTALASYDFLKKLQVVQNLDIRDRSILLRQSFTIISLLSCARDASRNKMSCLKFYNGSDCFLNNALTAPAELEIISNGPVTDFFSSQRFHISSRSVLSSKLSKKIRPSECLVCHRPAHQHHCGVPTCKGCKTFFRRIFISQESHKCHFDTNCFDEAERESFNLRCRFCRFQKCIQVGMNPNDLRLSGAESPITLTTTSDNLPLLLKQLAHLDGQRIHLLKNCSYDGDPTIEEISCMTTNLKFRRTPMAQDLPTLKWGFFTGLTAIDFMKKLDIVQKLEVKDRLILVRRSFTSISLLSDAHRALNNKMSYLTFQNGSDCFLSDAITVPADLENRIRCRLVGKICDLKMTYEEKLLLSVIFGCDPAVTGLSERGQSLISSHRNVYTSLLVQYCLQKYQKLGPSRFVDLLLIYDVIRKTQEDLVFHYLLCFLNNPTIHFPKLFQ
ncbi:hypothetical protein B9Z55_020958 [Caenorhabditis nigoni]|uniref:Nuclear receptor domain-containing protein n=1 Tax=Caenorhabditis nigoni TaxID=1611254 RepID=A0A2G5TPW8_9PELO|nr:hypothetical protein B9Z55_020958 [Caenorhabditis nigoni]